MKPTRYTKQHHRSCGRETNIRHFWVNGEKIAHTVARCIQFVNAVPGLAVKLVGSHAKVRDIVATDIDLSFQVRGPREAATATVQCGAVQCAIVEECCREGVTYGTTPRWIAWRSIELSGLVCPLEQASSNGGAVGDNSPCGGGVPVGQRENCLPSDHWVLGGAASVRRGAGRWCSTWCWHGKKQF